MTAQNPSGVWVYEELAWGRGIRAYFDSQSVAGCRRDDEKLRSDLFGCQNELRWANGWVDSGWWQTSRGELHGGRHPHKCLWRDSSNTVQFQNQIQCLNNPFIFINGTFFFKFFFHDFGQPKLLCDKIRSSMQWVTVCCQPSRSNLPKRAQIEP